MKRKFYFPLLFSNIISILMLVLPSCDHGSVEWDIYPVIARIYIKDVEGHNLLNPDAPQSLYGKNISIEYEGETYPAQWENKETRAYMPHFYGLRFIKGRNEVILNPNKNYLEFGEFEGAEDQDLSFILSIEDRPEKYHIEITHRFWYRKYTPHSSTIQRLNGVEIKESPLVITLE